MFVREYACGSCAIAEISGLGDHKNATEAMVSFCNHALGKPDGKFLKQPNKVTTIYYLFVAGPEVPSTDPGGSHHSKAWVKYGTEFAQFILDNDLGDIATLPPRLNLKHHPKTTAQAWLWTPNQEAIEKWWEPHWKPKVKK